jgi:hypothetical protein
VQTSGARRRDELNAELETCVSDRARTIRFGAVLAARGVTTVALDECGRLVRYRPDGITSALD